MILLVHMLFGATIGTIFKNPFLAIIAAFLSHFLLDIFPHIEYSAKNVEAKQWKKTFPDFSKIFLDILFGFLIIFFFSTGQQIIYVCAFFAILPDFLSAIASLCPQKICKIYNEFHWKTIHFLHYKKISNFWRLSSQILVVIISIFLLQK